MNVLKNVWRWLTAAAPNAKRLSLSLFEWFRAFLTGTGVLALCATLEWVAAHFNELPLTPEVASQLSRWIAIGVFITHVLVQLFQGKPHNAE